MRLLREVSWALGYAHLQGVVHKDVKPENILLEEGSGRAMVTDFGIAVLAEEAGPEGTTEVQGTAEFMSPEQAKGGEVDARSDLYSLACVGFFALSGKVAFSDPTPAAMTWRSTGSFLFRFGFSSSKPESSRASWPGVASACSSPFRA